MGEKLTVHKRKKKLVKTGPKTRVRAESVRGRIPAHMRNSPTDNRTGEVKTGDWYKKAVTGRAARQKAAEEALGR